jgi:phospholipid/cholesterol/gamma-HCH transport system substrate-binding protein
MSQNIVETIVGAIVIAFAIGFMAVAYQAGAINKPRVHTYSITANFENIDGIFVGSPIKVAGIEFGKVTSINLDHDYKAHITMSISKELALPADSSVSILSEGLLGHKFLAISPGASDELLENNDSIEYTQSSISLEALIGKFMFSSEAEK